MKLVRRHLPLLASFVLVLSAGISQAQMPSLDAKAQAEVVNKIADLLKDNYVFPDVAEKAGKLIQEQLAKGAYTTIVSPHAFSEQITRDLQSVTHDKHMRVFMAPPPPDKKEDQAERELRFLHHDARNNFGFYKLERLSGNVGYLDLRGFSPAEIGGATAIAAMNFLANSDAVIIDLRKNGGGDPSMIQLISSYFFKEHTHLNNLYWRKGDRTDQFWTLPYVPGKSMAETPLYVLTSARTFSGAEEFTNNMKVLKRAKIIGETTGGGANPGGFFPIAAGLGIFIPTGRAVNPVTGTNWEGTGVEPDEKVPAADSFNVAYKEALQTIESTARDSQAKAEAAWALVGVEAQLKPVTLSAADLQALAGNYGTRHVTQENGALYLQIEGLSRRKLVPMTADTFSLDGADAPRLRFTASEKGGRKLTELYPDGRQNEVARQ
jgi:hypothetical protein